MGDLASQYPLGAKGKSHKISIILPCLIIHGRHVKYPIQERFHMFNHVKVQLNNQSKLGFIRKAD